jgi:protein-arginine kinase activator protein McsA
MICDLCKDGEAIIQLTEIEGSGVRQLHLCE